MLVRRRGSRRLPEGVRREVIRLAGEGYSYRQIMERVDVSGGGITVILRPLGGVIRKEALGAGTGFRLSIRERQRIWEGLEAGRSFRAIARGLGRAPSTVAREVGANGGRDGYRPHDAQERAYERARRPKKRKFEEQPRLWDVVGAWLRRLWSPEQISNRLVLEFPGDENMRVSPETIYKSVYVQGRGELRKELAQCLRTGRASRKPQGRMEKRGKISDMVMISERPAEAKDRAVPGHWEGDLIMGARNQSAIGTLVERTTRYVMLLHLPDGKDAASVREAMTDKIQTLPEKMRRSITWDQGTEMAEHLQFRVDTGVDIYFCDPHSPWQRGSNENTNGLLRQYFPKGKDLTPLTEAELDSVADSLNGRPRQTLEWMTPSEKLTELFVAITN